jgi:hypothetical protein
MSDPTQSSAATAAGIAADYSARATYARGYEDGSKHVDEVGIQLVALRERLRLAMVVVEAARGVIKGADPAHGLVDALAALDAVPGDALPHGALASSGRLDALAARWVGPDGEPER